MSALWWHLGLRNQLWQVLILILNNGYNRCFHPNSHSSRKPGLVIDCSWVGLYSPWKTSPGNNNVVLNPILKSCYFQGLIFRRNGNVTFVDRLQWLVCPDKNNDFKVWVGLIFGTWPRAFFGAGIIVRTTMEQLICYLVKMHSSCEINRLPNAGDVWVPNRKRYAEQEVFEQGTRLPSCLGGVVGKGAGLRLHHLLNWPSDDHSMTVFSLLLEIGWFVGRWFVAFSCKLTKFSDKGCTVLRGCKQPASRAMKRPSNFFLPSDSESWVFLIYFFFTVLVGLIYAFLPLC